MGPSRSSVAPIQSTGGFQTFDDALHPLQNRLEAAEAATGGRFSRTLYAPRRAPAARPITCKSPSSARANAGRRKGSFAAAGPRHRAPRAGGKPRSLRWFCTASESRRCGRAGWSIMAASGLSRRATGSASAARPLSTDSPTHSVPAEIPDGRRSIRYGSPSFRRAGSGPSLADVRIAEAAWFSTRRPWSQRNGRVVRP